MGENPIPVGAYQLGLETVRLYLIPGGGGSACFNPPDGGPNIISIGVDQEWGDATEAFLHEAMEFMMHKRNLSFEPAMTGTSNDPTAFLFVLSHLEFTQIVGEVGQFHAACFTDFSRAWKKASR